MVITEPLLLTFGISAVLCIASIISIVIEETRI